MRAFVRLLVTSVTSVTFAAAGPGGAVAQGGGVRVDPSAGTTLVWEFTLDPEQRNAGWPEAPAIESAGSGIARLQVDTSTRSLRYDIQWSGLEGEVVAIELRGPAYAHQNTKRRLATFPVEVPAARQREGHLAGERVLELQRQPGFADLPARSILIVMMSSGAYVSIQTTAHPEGEIRGNLGAPQRR